jgi:hypothetical protein
VDSLNFPTFQSTSLNCALPCTSKHRDDICSFTWL